MVMLQITLVTHNPQITPISTFCVTFRILVVGEHRDFKFGYRLIVASPILWMTNRPYMERGYVTWPVLNFCSPIYISRIAEARAVKFCTQGDYIKSCQIDDKSPPKGRGWAHVTHFACAWATVDLEKFRHGTPLTEVDNAVDGGHLFLTHMTVDANVAYTVRLKLHQSDLSLYLLQMCLYRPNIMSTTNQPSGVWASACT